MKKILIVHTLSTYIDKEKSILSRSDFQIFSANSGEEAFQIHKTEKVDLIIVDLEMPGMAGDRLCSLIRSDDNLKHVSVIIVGSNSEADRARFMQCKANAYLTKPIRPVELLDQVSQYLEIPARKFYRVLLRISISGIAQNESFFCSSYDISVSGLLIETDRILKKGDTISCSFFLPRAERVITDAEVMRVIKKMDGNYQYGLRYKCLSPDCKSAIERFIENRS